MHAPSAASPVSPVSPAAASRPRLGPYTWEDFIALDEDDLRELIDGDLIEVEVPKRIHERMVIAIGAALHAWARERGAGEVLASAYRVRITDTLGVTPDVQYFRRGHEPSLEHADGLATGHPDLVVEVVSRWSRLLDRVLKSRWYAAIGVPEYWIVDPDARTLESFVLQDGRWVLATTAAGSETFSPPSFPGLAVSGDELWGDPGRG
jgi:Uma2 family endonuclease